jgi:hypothetical protein
LLQEVVHRLGQDAVEVIFRQTLQVHANRHSPLQLWQEVRGLHGVKRPGSDEEDELGVDIPTLGVDNGTLDDGQEVSLDTCMCDDE